ncbi:lysine 6-monooxygenase [Dictyobacter alpinus]|uniref:L-lysine N6-monooxygenase MbtG n=1 Tax=Dictyobacter alpinus TaxID=2014873 RepID=A0A402BDC8_9CHLR|nr:SidA/IucD/PvdA family monooxygenase [Dictyobacter alpinus]GCE29354.1 lysine 6-monooxygenase [Dictyobacter alpinus]
MRYTSTSYTESGHLQLVTPAAESDPQRRQQPTLLVLGAGPKAIAIAAKRAMMARLGYAVPRVVLIDRLGIAAHWSGDNGFTDGRQLLGTRPEKDIGYPYASTCWESGALNRKINSEMLLLSWHSFLIDSGGRYADWVDRGGLHPPHRQWSHYLQWVASKIQPELAVAEVQKISSSMERWQLQCAPADGTTEPLTLEGDGLVITGPGTPLTIEGQPYQHPRVMDGGSFWLHVDEFARSRFSLKKPLTIGIIGIGETAAAIILALLDSLRAQVFIEVISPYGVLYSRDEGFEENNLFSDPDGRSANLYGIHRHQANWLLLSEEDRREFVRRTDRGVFSLHAMEEINRAENVRSVVGTAQRMEATEDRVIVDTIYGGKTQRDEYDYVIVARGFDALWFTKLMDAQTYERLAGVTSSLDRRAIERSIGVDLTVGQFAPRLHLPMLAGVAQGPGFPNLSCLGLLSDRILSSYGHSILE